MILRRIIKHFKHQEWTAIGIDLVIVVLGVFIGIQVSNWNQKRTTDETAAVFAEHLKADLLEEGWSYQLMIDYNRAVLTNADRAANALDGKATLSDEALLVSAYRATQYQQPLRRRSTYDELISTGTIGLIRNRTLRDTAMRIYSTQNMENMVRNGMQSRYREAFRMSLPNAVQRALDKQCGDRYIRPGDYAGIPGILEYPCTTGLSRQTIGDAAKALRSNPSLLPLLRLHISDVEMSLVALTSNNRAVRLRAIAKEKP